MLRGKAAECVTLIAVAVGREVFASDADEVISVLLEMQEGLEPGDSLERFAVALSCSALEVCGRSAAVANVAPLPLSKFTAWLMMWACQLLMLQFDISPVPLSFPLTRRYALHAPLKFFM